MLNAEQKAHIKDLYTKLLAEKGQLGCEDESHKAHCELTQYCVKNVDHTAENIEEIKAIHSDVWMTNVNNILEV